MDGANTSAVWAVTNATGLTPDGWGEQWTTAERLGFAGLSLPIEALELAGSAVAQSGGRITVLQATAGVDGLWLGSTDPTNRADAVRHFIQRLTQASQAGADVLTIKPAAPRIAADPPDEYADVLHALHQSLRTLVGPVQQAGIRIGVDVGQDGFLLSPLETRELLDRVGRPEIGVCLDVTAVSKFSCPADWVLALRHRLNCIAIQSFSDTEVRSLGTVLGEVGYTGPIIFSGDQAMAGELMHRLVE